LPKRRQASLNKLLRRLLQQCRAYGVWIKPHQWDLLRPVAEGRRLRVRTHPGTYPDRCIV